MMLSMFQLCHINHADYFWTDLMYLSISIYIWCSNPDIHMLVLDMCHSLVNLILFSFLKHCNNGYVTHESRVVRGAAIAKKCRDGLQIK